MYVLNKIHKSDVSIVIEPVVPFLMITSCRRFYERMFRRQYVLGLGSLEIRFYVDTERGGG